MPLPIPPTVKNSPGNRTKFSPTKHNNIENFRFLVILNMKNVKRKKTTQVKQITMPGSPIDQKLTPSELATRYIDIADAAVARRDARDPPKAAK
ncbi:MAG: hypothetical protein PUD72_01890 [Oscillospiraceae bacterium]|nr:hypothetical protein [Oscillospiraceae bacterium]